MIKNAKKKKEQNFCSPLKRTKIPQHRECQSKMLQTINPGLIGIFNRKVVVPCIPKKLTA